ncbi:MAG: hypothetical protein JXR37_03320 [Kiritimatiellae bacterium]|nr:hypothetical protein [Kiritimatiellia bacterium]
MNLVREDQAREKWCPFSLAVARLEGGEVATGNRNVDDGSPFGGTHCLGPKCMCWHADINSPDMGYCGLSVKAI